MTNRELVIQMMEFTGRRNDSRWSERHFAPDAVLETTRGRYAGLDAIQQFRGEMLSLMPDATLRLDAIAEDRDLVLAYLRLSANVRMFRACCLARFEAPITLAASFQQGKVTWLRCVYDASQIRDQIREAILQDEIAGSLRELSKNVLKSAAGDEDLETANFQGNPCECCGSENHRCPDMRKS